MQGCSIATSHSNPLLDTQLHDIEIDNGVTDRYVAKIIADNLYSYIDSEGRNSLGIRSLLR